MYRIYNWHLSLYSFTPTKLNSVVFSYTPVVTVLLLSNNNYRPRSAAFLQTHKRHKDCSFSFIHNKSSRPLQLQILS
jgi:hypothetical protein